MRKSRQSDQAFRVIFIALVSVTLLLLLWQCAGRPAGPARIDWSLGRAEHP